MAPALKLLFVSHVFGAVVKIITKFQLGSLFRRATDFTKTVIFFFSGFITLFSAPSWILNWKGFNCGCMKIFIYHNEALHFKMLEAAHSFARLTAILATRREVAVNPVASITILYPQISALAVAITVDGSANDGRWVGKMLNDRFQAFVNAHFCSGWCAWVSDFGFLNEGGKTFGLFTRTLLELSAHEDGTWARGSIGNWVGGEQGGCGRDGKPWFQIIMQAQLTAGKAGEKDGDQHWWIH